MLPMGFFLMLVVCKAGLKAQKPGWAEPPHEEGLRAQPDK
jgi:hypothetical protein